MEQIRIPQGGLNLDDSVEIMSPDDWSDALNMVDGRSNDGKNGEKEPIKGTTSLNDTTPIAALDANSLCVGAIRAVQDNSNYLFFYNSNASKHCIVKLRQGALSLVLQWSGLNFSNVKSKRINGGGIAENLLFFTDNNNEPRCVHITRYSGGSTPATEEEILHIKRGPQFPPELLVTTTVVGSPIDLVENVQFSYQYEYTDGQISKISPWSPMVRRQAQLGYIQNVTMRVGSNEAIPVLVSKIRMIARKGNDGTPFYIYDLAPVFAPTLYTATYAGQNLGVIDASYALGDDLVPLTAKASCISKSRAWFANFVEGYDTPTPSTITLTKSEVANSDLFDARTFSPNSKHKIGVVFYDGNGRSCGVVDNNWTYETSKTIGTASGKIKLQYRITGTPPAWADYYALVMSKDTIKTALWSSWFTANTGAAPYVTVDSAGAETYSITYTAPAYVRLSMNDMNWNGGFFYSYKDGDYVMVTNATAGVTYGPLKVRRVTGLYVYVDAVDFANAGVAFTCNFQIYTPTTTSEELYYEIGQRRAIVGGALDTIDYYVDGPCIQRQIGTTQYMPQMNYKGNENNTWHRDFGKPYIKTSLGQVNKQTYIRHSSPFIPGTAVNGLSEFGIGDEASAPVETGQIQKLQPTMKEGTDGEIILAICNSSTYSVYINEARLHANDSALLINTTDVIGDIRKHRAGFGCQHPESVMEEDGYVYGYDRLSRAFFRYASNGMFPISELKVVRFFEDIYGTQPEDNKVVVGYDPFYKMVLVTFDIGGGDGYTLGYSVKKERWISLYSFKPDEYLTDARYLYSVVAGTVYIHDNSITFGNFYGTQYDWSYAVSFNDEPTTPKEWKAIKFTVGDPTVWLTWSNAELVLGIDDLTVLATNRRGQGTNIYYNEFEPDEWEIYGELRGGAIDVLNEEPMFSTTLQVKATVKGGIYKTILSMSAGCVASRGHNL